MTGSLLCDIYSVSFKAIMLVFFIHIKHLFALTYTSDGLQGSGKTMSLCHVVHFCYTQGWLVLHVPDCES